MYKNKAAQTDWFKLRHGGDLTSNQGLKGQESVIVIDDESVVTNAKQTNSGFLSLSFPIMIVKFSFLMDG